ncbi:MAG: MBL fold metallo-hydrolase [Acidobacteriota bacterium]
MNGKYTLRCFATGPFEGNVYLLTGNSGRAGAIFDPGIESEFLLDTIKKEEIELLYVINTHCHVDHAACNDHFLKNTKAKLLVHPLDKGFLSTLKEQGYFFGVRASNSPPPDIELKDGDDIIIDGMTLKVIHTPGHTPGGVCFYFEGKLIAGDTLFAGSVGRTDLPGGSFNELISSIKCKLFALPEETIVHPGHGPSTTIGEEKKFNPFLS